MLQIQHCRCIQQPVHCSTRSIRTTFESLLLRPGEIDVAQRINVNIRTILMLDLVCIRLLLETKGSLNEAAAGICLNLA